MELSEKRLGWKKSTTYTVLKKLCEKGIFTNENAVVNVLTEKEQVCRNESRRMVNTKFGGSLPSFIAAFIGDGTISEREAETLKRLIDSYKGE